MPRKDKQRNQLTSQETEQQADEEAQLDEAMGDIPYELLIQADRKTKRFEKKAAEELKAKKKRKHASGKSLQAAPDAPKEKSAKVKPTTEKIVFQSKRAPAIDPRFVGEPMDDFKKKKFFENYSFLTDIKEKENQLLSKEVRRISKRGDMDEDSKRLYKETIGSNKAYIKSFEKTSKLITIKEQIRSEARDSGTHLKKVEFKRIFQDKIKELKSASKPKRR